MFNFRNIIYTSMHGLFKRIVILSLLMALSFGLSSINTYGQTYLASPANWLFPNGNPEATRHQNVKSDPQLIDSFIVKWSTTDIRGDVQPLIGNIINNQNLISIFKYNTNEITAVVGSRVIVVDGYGKTHKIPNLIPFVKNVSVLFKPDEEHLNYNISQQVYLGLETIEFQNTKDSLAYAYVAFFHNEADTVALLGRLVIDLSEDYQPNYLASIKPVFGMKKSGDFLVYAVVNMSKQIGRASCRERV